MKKRDIEQFLAEKNIGFVGVSRTERKFSNQILHKLKESGYSVFPVHAELDSVADIPCVTSVSELPDEVSALMVAAGAGGAARALRDLSRTHIKRVWVFAAKGPEVETEIQRLEDSGISVISGYCPFMFIEPVTSVHAVHRFFAQLMGKSPR